MVRVILLGLLVLSVVCMVPLMGTSHAAAGHLHHDASASCATCLGPESVGGTIFLITLIGLAFLMSPAEPPRAPIRSLFHTPSVP